MEITQCGPAKAAPNSFRLLVLTGLFWFVVTARAALEPVEFSFRLPASPQNPFARDIWAEVITPSGKMLRLPAFYTGDDGYAVRARASEPGKYRMGAVTEKTGASETSLDLTLKSSRSLKVRQVEALAQVGLDQSDHTRFVLSGSGAPFTPIGANLAWASEGRAKFYQQTLPKFGAAGLNWVRIWMASWGGLNLDWLPLDLGKSPPAGHLDLRVAQDWDRIVANAETHGVYIQLVLQHHGQYSSRVNPNWKDNPWNAANPGGFLQDPKDFFTSSVAIDATAIKYRYIVARWGYSPAVLAWELFNEVHWVDPINRGHDESTVAQWHTRMADFIRSVDHYGHLVTTSTENLRSPIYERMDYFQPHLYPYAMLAGPLLFNSPYATFNRPVFYGETGDDHAPLSDEQKNSGIALVPPVWASLMGPASYPAQLWMGEKLLQVGRLGELGAVARFLTASGLSSRAGLTSFSPRVECAQHVPYVLEASQVWQRRAAPEFTLPLDGRMPVELADIPRTYVGSPASLAEGLPGRAVYRVDFPRETTLRARLTGLGVNGSAIRITVDGKTAVEKMWAVGATDAPSETKPVELTFTAPAGQHTLVVENPGAKDWFQLDQIATDLPVPVLAAIGKRRDDFLALWLWHRDGVFALKSPAPVGGTLLLDDVPAGKWTVTWWDTIKGTSAPAQQIDHAGGLLRVPIPSMNRHAAVTLTR